MRLSFLCCCALLNEIRAVIRSEGIIFTQNAKVHLGNVFSGYFANIVFLFLSLLLLYMC